MHEQSEVLKLQEELALTESRLRAAEEFFSEALAAVLLHTRPEWHFSPEEAERAQETRVGISRELDGGLTVMLEEDEGEEEGEDDDYFTEELNKRLGFDVNDLQALMEWW